MKLSVLLPIYNEEAGLAACLDRVLASPTVEQVVAVDDCSTDESLRILRQYKDRRLKIVQHRENGGKGASVRTALEHATGDYCIIQDADTEYDPSDYAELIEPIAANRAQVVYGKRDLSTQPLIGHLGNKFLTVLTNLIAGIWLDDMETCYKLIPTALMRGLSLKSRGFEIEPEITVKLAKRRAKIVEVNVSYSPRSDKKLRRIRDGFRSLLALIKYRFTD